MSPKAEPAHSAIKVAVRLLDHGNGLALPAYASEGAAGLDLPAATPAREPLILAPMQRSLVPTGLSLAIPPGYEAQIRPRSGLALTHGITVLNSPGTIDSDYRGEIKVLLINLGVSDFVVERGMRIAQLVLARVTRARLHVMSELPDSDRGRGGFGSTGNLQRDDKP